MDTKNTWDLTPLFRSDSDPEIAKYQALVEEKTYEFIKKWKANPQYLEDPQIMLEALNEYEKWATDYGIYNKVGYYFGLRSAQDQENIEVKAQINKHTEKSQKLSNDLRFFTHQIALIPKEKQEKFLNFDGLKKYKHYLEKEFEIAKHLLTEPEEKIMTLKSPTSHSNWVDMVSEFISKEEAEVENEKGEKVKQTFAEILSTFKNKNKKVRDSAAKEFNKIMVKHSDVAEHEINSILQDKKVNDELRKYSRPDEASLIGDDISTDIVDSLIEATTERFSTSARYYKLKAKLLGLPKLEYHERMLSYGSVEKEYSFEEAVELVNKSLKSIDQEFSDIFQSFLKNGQFDVFPRKGKSNGAFCAYYSRNLPVYILLNHMNKMDDVTTIAHEVGHGINDEFMRKAQHELYFGTSLAIAEVSSTFMEDFVLQELLKDASKEEQLALMMSKLDDDISTIYRQIACYKFEQELHKTFREKAYLSKKDIGELFQKNMAAYMGDAVEQSEGSENWWIYWSHIRRFFYVYSYASGLLISKSLQNSVKQDKKFVDKVKYLLSAGESESPKDIFANMGIDITEKSFWYKGLDEVDQLLDKTEALAKELGKI